MKKLITMVFSLVFFLSFQAEGQRYLTEVFSEVEVTNGISYARNITVITVADPDIGIPTPQILTLDLYTPKGDTETNRPLVIMFHSGNFLPRGDNGGVNGQNDDFPGVEAANRLAKMGYVVAMADYRLGWNPIADSRNERINTLINAAYRGVQDARSCVRFFRKDALDGNNQYGICSDRITYWGIGTGGYIALAAASIDSYSELVLPKFIDTDTQLPMVIESVHGDPFGTSVGLIPGAPVGFDTLSLPNHPGYDYEVQLAVNMGGAIGDTSWISDGDPAFISFQVPDDPFAPYVEDILVVPTTDELIVEVQGSYLVQQKAQALGLNSRFANAGISDAYTTAANANNDTYEGLYPFIRPTWPNPFNPMEMESEASPWEWWDSDFWSMVPHPSCPMVPLNLCNFDVIARINNPDASETKGKTYIDSIVGYFAPRAYAQLDLGLTFCSVLDVENLLSADQVNLNVAPNPAVNGMMFTSNTESPMENIEIYNLSGQLMKSDWVDNNQYRLERGDLITGLYIAKVRFADGVVTKKIVFE